MIFERKIFYENSYDIINKRLKLIKASFEYHYNANKNYREICNKYNIIPGDITNYGDLIKIPLIPIDAFKIEAERKLLLTVPMENIRQQVESSGTSGIPSISYKDIVTLDRIAVSILSLYREFFPIIGDYGMFFTIPPKYIAKLGLMKLITFMQVGFSGFDYVIDLPGDPPDFDRILKEILDQKGKSICHLIGAPFLIYDFIQFIKSRYPGKRFDLDPGSMVITIGGWKRKGDSPLCTRDELNGLLADIFNISNFNIRDIFAMAESNLFTMECEYQQKHVPPWGYFSIRNIENPLEKEELSGKSGILAIFDPLNNSSPGFILSGDIGRIVFEGKCKCGRFGQIFQFERRAVGAETRSCALYMDEFINIYQNKGKMENGK